MKENAVRVSRGGVSLHGETRVPIFGGKHLDLSEGVTLRGAAFNEGLRPAVAAIGASSPVGAVQSVTRVLERSNEEGRPLTRILCSGLSAHAVSRCESSLSGSSVARRSQGRNKALHGSLPVVWVTSRHGNAKRPKAVPSRARTSRTHGVSVRRYVIAEVCGRRFGPEKRWRFTLLTRKSDASVAGGLGRRGQLVMGKPVEERSASEGTSTIGPRRQSRGIDERWRRT